jgi:hypothetical protein
MSQSITQSTETDIVVVLTDTNGAAVTGILYGDIVAKYRKEGASSLTTKTVTSPDWDEIGAGVYTLKFTAAELNTLGSFTIVITGAGFVQYTSVLTITAAVPTGPTIIVPTCVVSGTILNIQGDPIPNASVLCTVLGTPYITNTAAIGSVAVASKTDSSGFFAITLARLALVDVAIPSCAYRRTITVPNSASADLFRYRNGKKARIPRL